MPDQKFEWRVKKEGKEINHIGTAAELRKWYRNGQLPSDVIVKRVGQQKALTREELRKILSPQVD